MSDIVFGSDDVAPRENAARRTRARERAATSLALAFMAATGCGERPVAAHDAAPAADRRGDQEEATDAAEPDAAEPDAAEPDAAEPDAAGPDAGSDGGAGGMTPDEVYVVTGTTYYLDAVNGDDARDGRTRATAWRTVRKALDTLEAGDAVLMRSGNYGSLRETAPRGRTDYVTFKADEGQQPVLTSVSIDYAAPADAFLRFDGLALTPDWVDPGADPQQPDAGFSTYAKSANPFTVRRAAHVRLLRSTLTGTNKYLTNEAIVLNGVDDVRISGVHGRRTWSSVFIAASRNVAVSRSLFHEGVGSCVRLQPNNRDVVIDGVHCHDFNWNESDNYCTRGPNTPHGSAVAIRSGDVTVRNSMFHDGWGSAGIMLYEGDHGTVAVYSNVLLENNVVYDINNDYPMRIYGLGANVVVRNNLLAGRYRMVDGRITPDGRYRYGAAFALHAVAPGHTPAGLELHNNILIGAVMVSSEVNEHHNFIWSTSSSGVWRCSAGPGTVVATCTYRSHPTLFESGFFADPVDFSPGHNRTLDFRLASASPAINAGDASDQPPFGKGPLDALGFVRPDGAPRNAGRHSAGPYEQR